MSDELSSLIILVVDDDPGVLRQCQSLLERAGHLAIPAYSPNEALSALARQPVNLVLIDIGMPGMNGYQWINQFRELQAELAVVVMSGYGTIEHAIESLQQGAEGLILKPFSENDLVQGIRKAYQRSLQKREMFRMQTLRQLFDITEVLFTERDFDILEDLILDMVSVHLEADYASLYRRDAVGEPLRLIDHRGLLPPQTVERLETELIDPAETANSPLWCSRDSSGEGWQKGFRSVLAELDLSAVMCVPIQPRDQAQSSYNSSVLFAARRSSRPPFQKADYEMFLILARQAGVALENAHLCADLQSNIEKLEESQNALIQAEKLAAAGRFTASIAHEINNPLQSVQNCLHLLGRNELTKEERHKYLNLARGEMDRLMSVVQRMLDLYRPGARDRQRVNINELIERVYLLVEEQLKRKSIHVIKYLSVPSPIIMVVRDQIQQVLLNLFLNSIEAMSEGGQIQIETKRKKDTAEIVFEDNGPGIPAYNRERIFEPFFSTKENGIGLGLPVSYGIISAHGGTLKLVPGRGRGACFQICLPAETKDESENINHR